MKLTRQERVWLQLDAKAIKLEHELRAVQARRRALKPHILHSVGLKGARDELLTGIINERMHGHAEEIRGN